MSPAPGGARPRDDSGLAALLAFLNESRGFDFSGYKRSSLERRIAKRMHAVGIETYTEYQDYLELTAEEFTELFDTILITVTSFYRDRPVWDHLAANVIPAMLAGIAADEPIRVWSAACATGEEAYTIAMILAEGVGDAVFRERVKIYATDVDERALAHARQAVFSANALKDLPPELRERFFEANHLGHAFRADLRRSVIFGRNDLVKDAPISRIDLLICRNALMYFTAETQERILARLSFALKPDGLLLLGKSEMLVTHADLFTPQNMRFRLFQKVDAGSAGRRLSLSDPTRGVARETIPQRYPELRDAAVDVTPIAQVLVDRQGFIATINHAARMLFNLGAADIGRPLQDVELSYRPLELRSSLRQAYDQLTVVDLGRVPFRPAGSEETCVLEVRITPLRAAAADDALGASISFEDVTANSRLHQEFERARRQLENAYEELQSTVEELETTNEELQSTNEELETTNEELQSANEELETMNEELQSTNEELETMNDEHQLHATELDRANLFLEGILGGLSAGVIVLDNDRRVQLWNGASADMWGLRNDEVQGVELAALDIGLPVALLEEPITRALAGEPTQLVVDALSRRGRTLRCAIQVQPLSGSPVRRSGAILLVSEDGQGPRSGAG